MMTPEERLKSCSVCKNRELDMQRGLLCGLTHEKPQFDDKCPDFESDLAEQQHRQERLVASRKNESISGWLAFFLWIGLGGGSLLTLITALREFAGDQYSLNYILLRTGTVALLMAVAYYAIYAFYKRMPNAVAVAKTYIAMIVIDGVVGVLLAVFSGEYASIEVVARQFIWASIWYSYLIRSSRVEELFPTASRRWGVIEKRLLIVYAVGYAAILMIGFVQPSANVLLKGESYIRQSVEMTQSELPIDTGDDTEISAVEYVDPEVRYSFRIKSVSKSEIDNSLLPEWAALGRQEFLSRWAALLMDDPFMAECCRLKKTIVFNYYDRSDEFLYDIVITPDEYKDKMSGIEL